MAFDLHAGHGWFGAAFGVPSSEGQDCMSEAGEGAYRLNGRNKTDIS